MSIIPQASVCYIHDGWRMNTLHVELRPGNSTPSSQDPSKVCMPACLRVCMSALAIDDSRGRLGPGSEFHCAHGDDDIAIFSVLDMRPLEYLTTSVPVDGQFGLRFTEYLVPSGTGTRLDE